MVDPKYRSLGVKADQQNLHEWEFFREHGSRALGIEYDALYLMFHCL